MTEEELAQVRDEVGDGPPDDLAIEEMFDRLGSVGATIYTVLSRRLAAMIAAPSQFSVPGEYSQSTAANIQALRDQLARWAAFAPNQQATLMETVQLVSRHSRTRRRDSRQALDTEV